MGDELKIPDISDDISYHPYMFEQTNTADTLTSSSSEESESEDDGKEENNILKEATSTLPFDTAF